MNISQIIQACFELKHYDGDEIRSRRLSRQRNDSLDPAGLIGGEG
jgi:hypothetical protein